MNANTQHQNQFWLEKRPHSITLFLLLVSICISQLSFAQYWMQKGGSPTVDEAYAIATDGSGNTYTTGYFTSNATFGATTLSSSGSTDIFLAKTNNQGNYVWAVKAGGSGTDRGVNITTDTQGNSYITGYFYGTANFGSTTLTSSGNQDIFIAKYNNAGTLQWAVKAGGSGADVGNGISLDNSGNVLVTGEFKNSATFGTTTLAASGTNSDAFTSKLSVSSGAFQWTEQGSSTLAVKGMDVTSDNQDNVYITGQFSGNVTFDVTHANTMYNVIYLVKYNSQGQEQWFRVIGGGTSCISNAMTSDASGNVYLTGNFTGNLTFFGSSNYTLTNTYTNRIFLAKYNSSGTLSWAKSEGSENTVTSNDIAIDGSGNAGIVGSFTCKFNEHAATYGQGTFNAVGYSDIFMSKYSSAGTHQYSKNLGGRKNDYGYGIAMNSSGQIHFAGSFTGNLFVPVSSNFVPANLALWTPYPCTGNSPYCSDADYGNFYGMPGSGNSDVAMGNCFDPAREPYDYYLRNGSGCSRPQEVVCIEPNCPNSITTCTAELITAYSHICPSVGPKISYQWSTPSPYDTTEIVSVFSSGTYTVTITSEDGCFSSTDDISVNVLPTTSTPTISDDKGFNTNAISPVAVELCEPDSALLTAGVAVGNSFYWTGPGLPAGGASTIDIMASLSGTYTLTVVESNGCSNQVDVDVIIYPPLDSFLLGIVDDSISFCQGYSSPVQLYDSISNPNANWMCLGGNYSVNTQWTVTPSVSSLSYCNTFLYLSAVTTGWYNIQATVIRSNFCETDTHYVSKDVYIEVYPSPVINPFTVSIVGSQYICPGDSALLVATGGPNYTWNGPGVGGITNDSIYITQPGVYIVGSNAADTNIYGCSSYYTSYDQIMIEIKPQPTVTASSELICPNDSVLLLCDPVGTNYHWEGPSGYIPGGTSIYATEPGEYYSIVNDSDSCGLVSNTIQLAQYATPQLLANGDLFICEDDSVVISVASNDSSIIEWQPPLSGSGLSQTVYTAGTYTCMISSCGIVTYASIEVLASEPVATIDRDRELCENDSVILSGTAGMGDYYWFPNGETTSSIVVDEPGTYVLSVVDTNGCEAVSDSVEVEIVTINALIAHTGDTVICNGESLVLNAPAGYDQYLWTPANVTTPAYTVNAAGTYYLSIIDTNGCKDTSAPFEVFMPDTVTDFEIDGELHFCEGDSVILTASENDKVDYSWSPTGYQGKVYVVDTSGTYALATVDAYGCMAYSDSITVLVEENELTTPETDDTLICAHLPIYLVATTPMGTIEWYDQIGGNVVNTGEDYYIYDPAVTTTYYVKSVLSVCSSEYTPVLLEVEDCDNLNAPNVFTPNGDGVNDVLYFYLHEATCFEVKVYDRWGLLMYESEDMEEGWDGTSLQSGNIVPDGTYYYIVAYCKYNGKPGAETGYITVFSDEN